MRVSAYRCNLALAAVVLVSAAEVAALDAPSASPGNHPWNYSGTLERAPRPAAIAGACAITAPTPRVLIAGDSWAQFMWDDDAHNEIFDKFGHADMRAVSRSLGSNPGPGYSGPEYAISGSEAREWVNEASYPWVANVVAELQALPSIDSVILSIGGNDILAGKSGGGWYKDMDLDVAASEAALFTRVLEHSDSIAQTLLAVRPQIEVVISSYEYPNFNVSTLWCWIYACPKRRDLSRDPVNALVTDAEINAMNLGVEARRILWTNGDPRLAFDHGVGEMHHYYGDGQSAAGILPRPGQLAPAYLPFPGGNPARPSLRANFRLASGIAADPIHLNPEAFLYKVGVQAEAHYFPRFRGAVSASMPSQGGAFDGWTDGVATGTNAVIVGDDGVRLTRGIVSVDTSDIPDSADIVSASLYLLQESRSATNPITAGNLGLPRLDIATGSFGAPEIEVGDATAAADAVDVGCFVGTADAEYYAWRIDLTPAGLAAINRVGVTQFRLAFSTVDAGVHRVAFKDGDALLAPAEFRETVELVEELQPDGTIRTRSIVGSALQHRGIAEVLGSAKPFLDVRYATPMFSDGFEGMANDADR